MTDMTLGLLALGGVAAVVAAVFITAGISITLELPLAVRDDLDAQLFARLRDVPGYRLKSSTAGSFVLSVRRMPSWAIVGVAVSLVTYPWAALVFLCVRHDVDLTLSVVPMGDGSALRVAGSSEKHLWRRLSRILSPLVDLERQAQTSRDTVSS